jgi:hypothetical protein
MSQALLTTLFSIEQVESMLKTTDPVPTSTEAPKVTTNAFENRNRNQQPAATTNFNVANPSIAIASDRDMDRWHFNGESPQAATANLDEFNFAGNMPANMSMGMDNISALPNNFTWEMIGLGLEEPLPPQETIDEL